VGERLFLKHGRREEQVRGVTACRREWEACVRVSLRSGGTGRSCGGQDARAVQRQAWGDTEARAAAEQRGAPPGPLWEQPPTSPSLCTPLIFLSFGSLGSGQRRPQSARPVVPAWAE
jgi:hypothetical protein